MPDPSDARVGLDRPGRRVDRGLVAVVVVLVASRVAAHAAGLRFDASPLGSYMQFLDPALLRADLLDSLWHLHMQPPLYNLALGLALKATGGDPAGLLHATHAVLGLVLAVATYRLLRRLGARTATAATVTCVLTVLPATLLYEHWLYVTYPAGVLLVLVALFLHRWAEARRTVDLAVALGSLAALVLVRSMFHPVLLLVVVAGLAWAHRDDRRRVAMVGLVPVLAVTAVLVHRVVVLDTAPATASCGGLTLARGITWQLSEAEREALVDAGVIDPVSLLTPGEVARDHPGLLTGSPPTGSPAMDARLKSTGSPNYNHRGFREVCATWAEDAVATARARPVAVARGQAMAWLTFFRPASDFRFFTDDNRGALAGWERAASLAAGQLVEDDFDYWHDGPWPVALAPRLGGVAWGVVALFLLVVPASTVRLWRRLRTGRVSPSAVAQAFLLLVVVWTTLVGNVEVGENQRFRWLLNAPMAALAVELVAGRTRRAVPGSADVVDEPQAAGVPAGR